MCTFSFLICPVQDTGQYLLSQLLSIISLTRKLAAFGRFPPSTLRARISLGAFGHNNRVILFRIQNCFRFCTRTLRSIGEFFFKIRDNFSMEMCHQNLHSTHVRASDLPFRCLDVQILWHYEAFCCVVLHSKTKLLRNPEKSPLSAAGYDQK